MKKLILNSLMMGFPILTSLSFISCNERKQFYNVLNKNKGVFKINKIESNNNDIYEKIFKENYVLFQFGNYEGLKNNYIEKEQLFTYIYKNVDKKIYWATFIYKEILNYLNLSKNERNELLNNYSLDKANKENANNIRYYSLSGNSKEKSIYFRGVIRFYNSNNKELFSIRVSAKLFFNNKSSLTEFEFVGNFKPFKIKINLMYSAF